MSLSVLTGPTSAIIPIAQRIGLLIGSDVVSVGPSGYSAAAKGVTMNPRYQVVGPETTGPQVDDNRLNKVLDFLKKVMYNVSCK